MKNLLLTTVIVGALLTGNETKAQLGFNLNVHIGNRPAWGVPGNVNTGYYYMPEIDTYYDLANEQFIYEDGGQWIFGASLPAYYRNYDLRSGYKVLVNERRPYMRADFYRQQYRNRYNTYRRENYDQRNWRPDHRNESRYDTRPDQGRYDGRNNQSRNDNHRFDQHNNDGMSQGRNDQRNDRIDNRNDQRPAITAPQQQQRNDDRKINDNDNRGSNAEQSRDNNRSYVPGQVRTAQRRGQ